MVTHHSAMVRIVTHAQRGPFAEENQRMHMATRPRRWTRADLERLPDDGNKYEVIHGELLVSPAPRPVHEYLKRAFRIRLEAYCGRDGIAHVFDGHPAFVTSDSETIPDIVVRNPAVPPPARWDDAPMPLLVVEVLSESTRRHDEVKKRGFYMESGIPEYWIVDGDARSVRVITPEGERLETGTLRWRPRGAEDTLAIDLRALFEEVAGPA